MRKLGKNNCPCCGKMRLGGLFDSGSVMPVSKFSSSKFISRGGRIPAPLQSLKN